MQAPALVTWSRIFSDKAVDNLMQSCIMMLKKLPESSAMPSCHMHQQRFWNAAGTVCQGSQPFSASLPVASSAMLQHAVYTFATATRPAYLQNADPLQRQPSHRACHSRRVPERCHHCKQSGLCKHADGCKSGIVTALALPTVPAINRIKGHLLLLLSRSSLYLYIPSWTC